MGASLSTQCSFCRELGVPETHCLDRVNSRTGPCQIVGTYIEWRTIGKCHEAAEDWYQRGENALSAGDPSLAGFVDLRMSARAVSTSIDAHTRQSELEDDQAELYYSTVSTCVHLKLSELATALGVIHQIYEINSRPRDDWVLMHFARATVLC